MVRSLVNDLVGTDMLGDAASLTAGHIRFADDIQKGCLAMIHVPENGDDRRAGNQGFLVFFCDDLAPVWQFPTFQTVPIPPASGLASKPNSSATMAAVS